MKDEKIILLPFQKAKHKKEIHLLIITIFANAFILIKNGLWFLGCTDEFDISYNVEKYSIEKNQGAVKDEK